MTTAPRHARRTHGRRLGWLSIGLGALPLLAPRAVARMAGLQNSARARAVLPLVGVRELLHGAGLLTGRHCAGWAWTRVAGDALDLTTLGVAVARREGADRRRLVRVTGAVAAISAVDVIAAARISSSRHAHDGPLELSATTTVRRPRPEVYDFWRRLENLPTFMVHLDEVETLDDRHSRWRATAPFGRTVSWDAEVTQAVRDTRLEWRSIGHAPRRKGASQRASASEERTGPDQSGSVPNEGSVTFATAPDGMSTEVHVRMRYDLPGGRLGAAVARYFGEEPHQQVDDDLRRFKQVMETGEVVRSDGAPWGKRARHEYPQRPAQPLRADARLEAAAT